MKNCLDVLWLNIQDTLVDIGCYKDLLYFLCQECEGCNAKVVEYMTKHLEKRREACYKANITSQTSIDSFLSTMVKDTK